MERITTHNSQNNIINQQNVLIDKLLTKIEDLKNDILVVKKENKYLKKHCIKINYEAELYKNYCKNVKHIKWDN